jgi:hypothetical protein
MVASGWIKKEKRSNKRDRDVKELEGNEGGQITAADIL